MCQICLGIYLFKVNIENTRTMSEIYSKLPVRKTSEHHHRRRSGAFIVNPEQISHIVRVFSMLALKK